jgi:23S rRNA pseudoU1915 N3-methylase RlmH
MLQDTKALAVSRNDELPESVKNEVNERSEWTALVKVDIPAVAKATITFKYPCSLDCRMKGGEALRMAPRVPAPPCRGRGQVAIEYVIVMAFALMLIAPLIIVYYSQTTRLGDETTSATVERAATQIAEAADTVYYLGAPSMRTLTVDLPENVKSVQLSGRTITFVVGSSHGNYEQNGWSAANLTGGFSVTTGPHVLVLTALSDSRVNITER